MKKLPFYLYILANFIVAYVVALFFVLCIIVSIISCESQKDIDERFEKEKAKVDSAFSADSIRHWQQFDSIQKETNKAIEKILK